MNKVSFASRRNKGVLLSVASNMACNLLAFHTDIALLSLFLMHMSTDSTPTNCQPLNLLHTSGLLLEKLHPCSPNMYRTAAYPVPSIVSSTCGTPSAIVVNGCILQ
jgi:hypothetical protein